MTLISHRLDVIRVIQKGECLVRQRKGSVQSVSSVPLKKAPTNYQLATKKNMENKNTWSKILHIIITVLTAIATTFGVTSCMAGNL